MLYKCEGFTEKCYLYHYCVIKNTFDPSHIWLRNNMVRAWVAEGKTITVFCKRDQKNKKVEVAE